MWPFLLRLFGQPLFYILCDWCVYECGCLCVRACVFLYVCVDYHYLVCYRALLSTVISSGQKKFNAFLLKGMSIEHVKSTYLINLSLRVFEIRVFIALSFHS